MKEKNKLNTILTPTFCIGGGISLIIAIASMLAPEGLAYAMQVTQAILATVYGWFIQIVPVLSIGILVYLAISDKYGNMIIGGKNAKTEYSTFTWIGMLFTASIGGGLVTFAVNEPLISYLSCPTSLDASSKMEAVNEAMMTSLYHWGSSVWGIFALAGIGAAYFVTHHNARYLPGDSIIKAWPEKKWTHKIAILINSLACVCAVAAVSASIGFGVAQIGAGADYLIPLPENGITIIPYIALVILIVVTILAVSTKTVGKGMSILSDWNMYLCIGILLFTVVFGPTRFIMESFVQNFGKYTSGFISRSFEMFTFGTDPSTPSFLVTWDVSNNMFWISWAPFMSIFIATISKGRTIRQFVIATLIVPTLFILLWMSTYGGMSLLNTIQGDGSIAEMMNVRPDMTFFMIIAQLPFAKLISILSLVLIMLFLATTYTSTALALSRITDRNGRNISNLRSIAWVGIMGGVAVSSLIASSLGGSNAIATIRAVGSTVAYSYVFFLIMTNVAFLRRLFLDKKKCNVGIKEEI